MWSLLLLLVPNVHVYSSVSLLFHGETQISTRAGFVSSPVLPQCFTPADASAEKMDGWVDAWMDDGQMDIWMNGQMDG